ncbi:MAG: formylmethanofuran dehydrogenase subunit A [Candidatus Lokiarchaeota archaeon]|nr:formylmethanofuran dehydrogenase subunit A [Candidatus Lokiarchaeota archaeon]
MNNSITIKNGLVYDPLNDINGEKKDIYIVGGKISEKLSTNAKVIDATGMIIFPGGVDIHSHIAGAKVNSGRAFRPEDHIIDPVPKTKTSRSGVGYSVPSTWVTGYRYAKLGYTTVVEPAMPLLQARHTHEEFLSTPIIDKAAFPLFGNNWYVMEFIKDKDWERLAGYVAWILKATKGYGVKIVNPGGVENWAWGKNVDTLDDHVLHFEVSPREILEGLGKVNELLELPHPIHVHGNNLGHPGNYNYSLDIFKEMEKLKAKHGRDNVLHYTHCQFNAYGGSNWKDFCSGATEIAKYINSHQHITMDMGQIVFAKAATTTMTADGPWEFALHHISGMSGWGAKPGVKWINGQVEGESGSGLVPYFFDPKIGVNAIQWAIGLELALLIENPWQIYMTTDHPNGGPFIYYPKIIRWLMDKKTREDMLNNQISKKASSQTTLPNIERELSLNDICIMTRAGPAKCLGMEDRGHLGFDAIGDISIFKLDLNDLNGYNIEKAFSNTEFTIKDGQIVVYKGDIISSPIGTTLISEGKIEDELLDATVKEIKNHWRDHYSINFNNYEIGKYYTPKSKIINNI